MRIPLQSEPADVSVDLSLYLRCVTRRWLSICAHPLAQDKAYFSFYVCAAWAGIGGLDAHPLDTIAVLRVHPARAE